MKVIKGITVFWDVDDTLVKWGNATPEEMNDAIPITCPISSAIIDEEDVIVQPWTEYLRPHKKHIAQIKLHKMRGHRNIVWSAGGAEWAEAVVQALGIEEYVDIVMGKPSWYYDDLRCDEYMGNPQYLKDE